MSDAEEKISAELLFSRSIASARAEDKGLRWASNGHVLHEWTGLFWRPLQVEEVEHVAWAWLREGAPEKATPRVATSCAAAAVLEAARLPERQADAGGPEVVLPTRNGALEIWKVDEGDYEARLRAADRADGLTYCLACNYKPGAAAPQFLQFVADVLPDARVLEYVQEYIGYTLLPDTRFQRAQFWLGGGANGKSTLAEIIAALHEKTSAMTLDSLDGFKLGGLLGASLVYVDETPGRIDEQKLKALISGGLVQVDRKYRDPLSLRPTAKWIICGNNLPAISDQSTGFWRRFPVVPFTQSFPDGKADPLLARRIIGEELDGVLNWALEGLLRLLERGRFGEMPVAVVEAIAGGKRETNSVLGWWADEEPAMDESALTPKSEIYESYAAWCRRNGASPVASPRFWRRLAEVAGYRFSDQKATVGGKRVPVAPLKLAAPAWPLH